MISRPLPPLSLPALFGIAVPIPKIPALVVAGQLWKGRLLSKTARSVKVLDLRSASVAPGCEQP